jgi:hypothetical protein
VRRTASSTRVNASLASAGRRNAVSAVASNTLVPAAYSLSLESALISTLRSAIKLLSWSADGNVEQLVSDVEIRA